MSLDAVIIADSGSDSLSGSNPLRLTIDGKPADIQLVLNYITHGGRIVNPVVGDGQMSWASAPKLNGIFLFDYLSRQDLEVELVNSFYEDQALFSRWMKQTPRAVVISTTFIPGKKPLFKLVEQIRNSAPEIFIIAGGPLIYLSYLMLQRTKEETYDTEAARDDFLFLTTENEPAIDAYIISLRGEQILCDMLKNIKEDKSIDDLPNTARLAGTNYEFSRQINDLSDGENFSVDWSSLPDDIFASGVVPLQASTGCPYQCAFCNFTKDRRLTYVKPVDQLISEMKAVQKRGARYIWFVDDNFRLGKKDIDSVCRRFIEEGLNLRWMTFIRASTLKETDMGLLRQAGCIEVQLGLESADQKILENMNKKATPELYSEVIGKILSAGINCSSYFIFGFPGETDKTVQQTRDFIKKHEFPEHEGALSWSLFPFLLSPLSPIYEPKNRKKFHLTGYMHRWQHQTMNAGEAKEHILKTFLSLENSGPIYRGGNQDMLRELGPAQRKKFDALRHKLSKGALQGRLGEQDILESFTKLLGPSKKQLLRG